MVINWLIVFNVLFYGISLFLMASICYTIYLVETDNDSECLIIYYAIPFLIYLIPSLVLHILYLVMISYTAFAVNVYNKKFINYFRVWFWRKFNLQTNIWIFSIISK